MANLNKVIIAGNLGRDPEIRHTGQGDRVCHLQVATSDRWVDRSNGEKKEQTQWHHVVLFRKLADVAAEFLRKGEPVYVEGHLKTHKWTDARNVDRYQTEIYADRMQMLGHHASAQDAELDEIGVNDGAGDPVAYQDESPVQREFGSGRRDNAISEIPF